MFNFMALLLTPIKKAVQARQRGAAKIEDFCRPSLPCLNHHWPYSINSHARCVNTR